MLKIKIFSSLQIWLVRSLYLSGSVICALNDFEGIIFNRHDLKQYSNKWGWYLKGAINFIRGNDDDMNSGAALVKTDDVGNSNETYNEQWGKTSKTNHGNLSHNVLALTTFQPFKKITSH